MSKFTPGPWKARIDARGWWRIGPSIRIEPKAGDDPAVRVANARLIVAAPDLMEALQKVVPALEGETSDETWGALINECRAAIAKATE